MPRYGFVRSELEIKTLILYVLHRAAMAVAFEDLLAMSFVDGAIDYFEFADHLAKLVETGHVELCDDSGLNLYSITQKGIRDLEVCRSSVPRAVLRKADAEIDRTVARLVRKSLVNVRIEEASGKFTAQCSLKDDKNELLTLSMLASSREEAKKLTVGFYKNAERIYNVLLTELLDEGSAEE